MPFLLLVFLTLACLPELKYWPQPLLPAPPGVPDDLWAALLTWLAVAALVAHAWWLARRTRRPLDRDPAARAAVLRRYEKGRARHQIALFAVFALALCVFGWGWAVHAAGAALPLGALPLAELWLLAPFFAGMILSWAFFYDADRAAHLAAHRLFAADPLARALLPDLGATAAAPPLPREFGSRTFYLVFQLRQKLVLVFLPVALLLGQKELQRWLGPRWDDWQGVLNVGGLFVVAAMFVGMPWAVRLLLGLRPLPAGPLRDRLTAAARRVRFRCTDILVWDTRGGMANAMVVGLAPWPRYVVFTDRLLEDFTPDEVEAVFGHEVGHVKHHHMLLYLGFLMTSLAVLMALAHLLLPALGEVAAAVPTPDDPEGWTAAVAGVFRLENFRHLEALPPALVLLAYIFVVFGFLSRRCERQADLYGCRMVSCARRDCWGHDAGDEPVPRARGLCPTGIRTFITALEKVAVLNGLSRDRPGFLQSWQHSTIARRVAFLQTVLDAPGLEPAFQRRVALMKVGLFAVLFAALGVLLVWPGG